MVQRGGGQMFAGFSLADKLTGMQKSVAQTVESLPAAAATGDSVEIARRLTAQLSLSPLTLEIEKANVGTEETRIDVSHDQRRAIFDRSRPCYVSGTAVTYYIPFSGDPKLFDAGPNEYDWSQPRGLVRDDELLLQYTVEGTNVVETKSAYEQDLVSIRTYVDRVNAMIVEYNNALPGIIAQHLAARQQRLKETQKGLEDLGLPVRGR